MPSLPPATSNCSAGAIARQSAWRRWAVRRSSGREEMFILPAPRSAHAFPTRSAPPAARPSRKSRRSPPMSSGSSSIAWPANGHAVGLDLVRRAEAAGCRTLVLTLDVPVRTTRPREVATGIAGAFNVESRHPCRRSCGRPGWVDGGVEIRHPALCQSALLCRRRRFAQ